MGYLTLQLALGAWASSLPPVSFTSHVGLFIVDLAITGIAAMLLYNNYRRRIEVARTVKRLNLAFGYTVVGAYLPRRRLNPRTHFRPWWWWYCIGLIMGAIGFGIILFGHYLPISYHGGDLAECRQVRTICVE